MTKDKILNADLIVFDKDGTLIDFHAMWGQWVMTLAGRLKKSIAQPIDLPLFEKLGFDITTGQIIADGHLALDSADEMRAIILKMLQETTLSAIEAEIALNAAWCVPDPVTLARPLADLNTLFSTIKGRGTKIAIVTSDDHQPTQATITALGVADLVDIIIGADDCVSNGLLLKPAPDAILSLCQKFNISPAKTVMVGDNIVDLQMGQAAQVGLTVGVLSGLCSADELTPYADIVLPSVEQLISEQ